MLRSPERRVAREEVDKPTEAGSRRRFLAYAAALGTVGSVRVLLGDETMPPELEPKNVNKHLQRFTDKLPHVARITPDLYKGARHGLIIVRQVHWAGDLSEKDVKEIASCQEEIRALLEELVRKKWIDSVHQEGRMAAGEPKTDPNYDKHPAAAEQGLRDVPRIAEFGAVNLLMENGLRVKGGERTKEYDASGPALYMPDGPERTELLFEARERALMKIVHEGRDRIACTVYGAAHDWKNNVEEWNDEHPDDQFSILTLTTKTVWERDRRAIGRRQNWTPRPPEPLPTPPPPAPLPDPTVFSGPEKQPGHVAFPSGMPKAKPLRPFIEFPF